MSRNPRSLILPAALAALSVGGASAQDLSFDWNTLAASTNFTWQPCYDSFQCARLQVPLEYSNPSGEQAAIAVVRLPSNFSSSDSNYLGPILLNPGGPGSSGVSIVLENASLLRQILGPQFDFVGFDPRGVGATTPYLTIFNNSVEAGKWYAGQPLNANQSIDSVGRDLAQSTILSDLANDRSKKVAETVNTPTVATDMLSIVKAFGQDKLQYWGFSYGSVLGATYAAMFPDNVGRLVIDGVINSHEWYAGNYSNFISNVDQALTNVYDACVAAGPSTCAIYEKGTDLIRARVNKLIEKVHLAPVPVYNDTDPKAITFSVVDYSVLTGQIFNYLYTPYDDAPTLAEGIAALEEGNGSLIYSGSFRSELDMLLTCDGEDSSQSYIPPGLADITASVTCGDRVTGGAIDEQDALEKYQDFVKTSTLFGPVWYPQFEGLCSGWDIEGTTKFNASFTQNTSFPLLLIGNSADPITPLASARNMSAGFAGSVVLQQNTTGHTSQSGFTTCTAQAIRAYFLNGTLPKAGTVCQPETVIFGSQNDTTNFSRDEHAAEDLALRDAVREFRRSTFVKRAVMRK